MVPLFNYYNYEPCPFLSSALQTVTMYYICSLGIILTTPCIHSIIELACLSSSSSSSAAAAAAAGTMSQRPDKRLYQALIQYRTDETAIGRKSHISVPYFDEIKSLMICSALTVASTEMFYCRKARCFEG